MYEYEHVYNIEQSDTDAQMTLSLVKHRFKQNVIHGQRYTKQTAKYVS